ncbi:N-6 DNA methylase [Thermococcus sp.]|uniref:Eco57I restriction-modification methylase domain-containing protein n=1 Tax=Thermococcus sp. TaxID=35749 RepID=UPI0025FB4044|nr:N-6 DNA methylase [Thermococcus sp.]
MSEAESVELYPYYLGVVFDGYTIAFVRYWKGSFKTLGPVPFNEESLEYLLDALRGLTRKPLEAETLLKDFGPKSKIAHEALKAFYNALENPNSERIELLFEDWRRIFSQVCSYTPEKLKKLAKFYGFENADPEKLTFALHTYYTLLMKLIVSEIVSVLSVGLAGSILARLHESYLSNSEGLRFVLEEELEEGGLFRQLGIRNFLEADYFAWYLEEWNEEIARTVHEIVKALMDYEPSTVEQTPERVEDLFKRLYQNLVPKEIRHSLGEYFTPDWLAELTLDEAGYDGNPDVRLLDPACGSGTFLVLAIKRAREWALEHWGVSPNAQTELLEKITKNIVGIDLNPLAVLASKANYLIALGKMIRYRTGDVTIPVYLADSITVSTKTSARGGKRIALKTVAGEFEVPLEIIEKGLVDKVFEAIEDGLRRNYSPGKFLAYLYTSKLKGRKFSQDTEDALKELYKKLYRLEQEGKDRIWTRVLRNAFAPLTIGKFDFVVGNPPWINWESLPENYRELTKPLWQYYGLEKGSGKGMGKVKRDMAMLFVARTFDRYLKPGGKLAFLVPFTLFKTQAGAGFRKFLAHGRRREPKIPVKVLKVHDLVTLYPFEGATTRTGMLVIEKSEKTEFPIPLVVWNWPDSRGADVEATLEDVKKKSKVHQLVFMPIEEGKPESPWMMTTEKAYKGLKKALGSSEYNAHAGIFTGMNGVYWVKVVGEVDSERVVIENLGNIGKKKVRTVRRVVEKDLLYPLVRGQDHNKWHVEWSGNYILVPHDTETGKPLPEDELKVRYPLTYEYLKTFEEKLKGRSIHKLWGRGNPFYAVYDIGAYTFKPYKVVWKYIAGKISGKAEFSTAVMGYHSDRYLGEKILIPNEKLMLVPLENEDEAHYLSAVLNSTITQLIVASYTIETQISTHVLNNVNVPTFDPSNEIHLELAELSKKAHEISGEKYELLDELKGLKTSLKGKRGDERKALKAKIEELREKIGEIEEKLGKIEAKIDEKVARLYGITEEELEEIERLYGVLME